MTTFLFWQTISNAHHFHFQKWNTQHNTLSLSLTQTHSLSLTHTHLQTHLSTQIARPGLVGFELLSDNGEVDLMGGKTCEIDIYTNKGLYFTFSCENLKYKIITVFHQRMQKLLPQPVTFLGWKMNQHARKQYIFWSCNTYFQCYVFLWKSWCKSQCEKANKKA